MPLCWRRGLDRKRRFLGWYGLGAILATIDLKFNSKKLRIS